MHKTQLPAKYNRGECRREGMWFEMNRNFGAQYSGFDCITNIFTSSHIKCYIMSK